MTEETQELLNEQFEKRISKLEDNLNNISKDLTEMKCDIKSLIKSYENINKRFEEYDSTLRKNLNDIRMKFILTIVGGISTAILIAIGLIK